MSRLLKNPCNQYIAIYFLYDVITTFVGKFSFMSILMYVFIGISVYYFIYANLNYKLSVFFKVFNVFVLLLLVYGLILALSSKTLMVTEGRVWRIVDNGLYVKQVAKFLLPLYAFYVFAKKSMLTIENIRFWTILFLLFATFEYFHNASTIIADTGNENGITNNISYYFVAFIPLIMLVFKRPSVKIALILYCSFFIIMGGKRGAIVCGTVSLFLFFAEQLRGASVKKYIGTFALLIVFFAFVYFVFNWSIENNPYFLLRIERLKEGDIGHRSDLYGTFWGYFVHDASLFHQIFGNGANSTLLISDNYAHNDWLELLTNQGLIGVGIYAVFFVCFFREIRYQPVQNKTIFAIVLVGWFLKTIFSMGYRTLPVYQSMLIGYLLATSMNSDVKVYSLIERNE